MAMNNKSKKEMVQKARKYLVNINRSWRLLAAASEKRSVYPTIYQSLGFSFTEFVQALKGWGDITLEPIVLPADGVIFGFTSPDVRTGEKLLDLCAPLTHILHECQPFEHDPEREVWCQIIDVLTYEALDNLGYTSLEQISTEYWNWIVEDGKGFVKEGIHHE
jgi:hypothetical protein